MSTALNTEGTTSTTLNVGETDPALELCGAVLAPDGLGLTETTRSTLRLTDSPDAMTVTYHSDDGFVVYVTAGMWGESHGPATGEVISVPEKGLELGVIVADSLLPEFRGVVVDGPDIDTTCDDIRIVSDLPFERFEPVVRAVVASMPGS